VYLFGVDVVDAEGRLRRRQAFRSTHHLAPREALLRVLTDSAFVRMPGWVMRRDLFLEIGGFDVSLGAPADFDLAIRLFSKHGVTCAHPRTAQYVVHDDAVTSGMFSAGTIEVLSRIFDTAVRTGTLSESQVRRAQADWFHQFILGGAYRKLQVGRTEEAKTILALFAHPAVRGLGPSRRWSPARRAIGGLASVPAFLSRPAVRLLAFVRPERLLL
jgi:hypothetical protein